MFLWTGEFIFNGKFIIQDIKGSQLNDQLKEFIDSIGFKIVQEKTKDDKIMVKAVNMTKTLGLLFDRATFSGLEEDLQRIGIELDLAPADKGIELNLSVLPYMALMDRPEIPVLTQQLFIERETDRRACKKVFDKIIEKVQAKYNEQTLVYEDLSSEPKN